MDTERQGRDFVMGFFQGLFEFRDDHFNIVFIHCGMQGQGQQSAVGVFRFRTHPFAGVESPSVIGMKVNRDIMDIDPDAFCAHEFKNILPLAGRYFDCIKVKGVLYARSVTERADFVHA